MPGITERQLHKGHGKTGLRNLRHVFGSFEDADYFYTNGDPDALTAGEALTLLRGDLPEPRSINVSYTATDTGDARLGLSITVYGTDQFGREIQETIENASVANDSVEVVNGVKVFATITRAVNNNVITDADAADTLEIGLNLDTDPEEVIYGLPIILKDAGDILGSQVRLAGTTGVFTTVTAAQITFVTANSVHGVKFASAVAPDSTGDREVHLWLRTSL